MTFPKKIVLCADDFGLSEGVSQGILKLVQSGRLSAVSCMTNAPYFSDQSKYLSGLHEQASFGLHFNLTEGQFLSAPEQACFTLKELLLKSHMRRLNVKLISKELNSQFESYVDHVGQLPRFIDGHQHVHQFPQIREILLQFYKDKLEGKGIFIRSTYPAIQLTKYAFKTRVLTVTGGKQLHLKLNKASIPYNSSFAGIYDFSEQADYRFLFRQWLSLAEDNTLIMCHPGNESSERVEHAATRNKEWAYFASDNFLRDCEEFQIQLTTSPKF